MTIAATSDSQANRSVEARASKASTTSSTKRRWISARRASTSGPAAYTSTMNRRAKAGSAASASR